MGRGRGEERRGEEDIPAAGGHDGAYGLFEFEEGHRTRSGGVGPEGTLLLHRQERSLHYPLAFLGVELANLVRSILGP